MSLDYKKAGVNIDAGEEAVQAIKQLVRTTYNKNVLSDLGSFGGLYKLDLKKWKQPVMVASTDGVGTKLRLAIEAERLDTVGQDLVNHCVNDILVQGALPQFFLDYIGVGKLKPEKIKQIISGFVKACRENNCVLIGGEMAEMPGFYSKDDFDLAGTIVGLAEKRNLITGKKVKASDQLIGLSSNGLHTNGYALARTILNQNGLKVDSYIAELESTVADAFLQVHKSYLKLIKPLLELNFIHGMAHITGGGIPGNLSRVIPAGLCAHIDESAWEIPPIFKWLKALGKISQPEMRQVFNLGIGMILIVAPEDANLILSKTKGILIGTIEKAKGADTAKVRY
ncbi:MAG TPA: phosphoribosylformylglycinamidine cyclo-ligase [Candidatus Cloacimonadota bacterium]|nr:phosphoribosylformylglycinamidine cyclo-ligase [Candidatus Cloacimonadota bacterium]HQL14944.1 phosphoribosylformylglycinamidine cyclo-ligase [Candidatus Cloacimonadota bacterium]